ncbi:family 43 glycosylhydrolase [Blautia marasmi]|uniref:family 43 glycosylhydrolase n=1 Tax=Blautia marasmi TaxID=1917868 RepID=UPI00266DB70D|nr:family 43 glycosylhydrolase [Blautia marasmi]
MDQRENGYLFVHFTGESPDGEQVYFALSRDGMHWQDLNGGRPVIRSGIGEKGVRDPFIIKSVIDGKFYIIATDLRIASKKGWTAAQMEGSTRIIVWCSEDLLHWSEPWSFETGIPGAGCAWAPEAIYDPEKGSYLVFWASMTKEPGDSAHKQRIYCSYTRDFRVFTAPEKYIERDHHVIDTTIIEEEGVFYRFSKDETNKNIRMDKGTSLQGEFTEVCAEQLGTLMGVEGPAAFPMGEKGKWCLMVDRFAEGLGYLPLICTSLENGDFKVAEAADYDMGNVCKRHGSVLVLKESEYQRLYERWGSKNAEPDIKVNINTKAEKAEMQDLFGIFFEDLNHAADGGLYAELIQNRAFEFCSVDNPEYHGLTAWEKIEKGGKTELRVEKEHGLFPENPHYLVMEIPEAGEDTGVWNLGFGQGISFEKNESYDFTCYARKERGDCEQLEVSLRSANGQVYTCASIYMTEDWEKYQLTLQAPMDDRQGRLAVTVKGSGCVELDFVSLFPRHTYKNRKNGLRRDLAQLLEDMHPKFLRFPGGCLIHGGSLHAKDRGSLYRWKNTIGPVENRPACRNNWGYNQTMGLGYYEYFLLCEDLGAKPVPVLPGGYNPHTREGAVGDELEGYIQDALDLIEFANGDADSFWGARRAKMGHPEPFHLEYIGIGNEEVGEPFFERYPLFHKAIREKYPEIRIIGTSGPFAAGREYDRGWRSAREEGADLVDEHYYQSPEWFIAHHHRYDAFPENGPKVFLGEYASHDNTWFNALAEASFMVGMQNAAHAVKLACYAPLFCHKDYVNWEPDMIWMDNHRAVPSPSYYVQKLFMNHHGDVVLQQEIEDKGPSVMLSRYPDSLPGSIVLEANESEVVFDNIVITEEETGKQYTYPKTVVNPDKPKEKLMDVSSRDYTIHLHARELSGKKGFTISFGQQDEKNRLFWEIGGWANQDSIIGEDVNGRNSCLIQRTRSVEVGRTYDLEIRVRGRRVETFVDGVPEQETEVLRVLAEPVYITSSLEKDTGDVIIKLVNVLPREQKVQICLEGEENSRFAGSLYRMDGFGREDRNTFEHPDLVTPKVTAAAFESNRFEVDIKPESICILRLHGRQNPVLPGLYADPDVLNFNGTYYLYPTTDGFSHWSGTKFHVFSSKDLRKWKDEGIILDVASEQVPWSVGSAWAPAVFQRNGRFYYYFCAKRPDGVSCIGAAVSDSPVSGFLAQPEPLLTPETVQAAGVKMSQVIDPSIYEEDGQVYMLFGNGEPAIVKLSDDLLHVCPETMKNLEGAEDFREAVTVLKRQGIYHFTWSCEDTGCEDYHVNYGISKSLYGPVKYLYPVLLKRPETGVLGTGHHCIFKGSGEDTYYMAYHRFATPFSDYPEGKGYHRETCMDRVEFGADGLMKPVYVNP